MKDATQKLVPAQFGLRAGFSIRSNPTIRSMNSSHNVTAHDAHVDEHESEFINLSISTYSCHPIKSNPPTVGSNSIQERILQTNVEKHIMDITCVCLSTRHIMPHTGLLYAPKSIRESSSNSHRNDHLAGPNGGTVECRVARALQMEKRAR